MTENRYLLLFGRSTELSIAEVNCLIEIGLISGCIEKRLEDGLVLVGPEFPAEVFARMGGTVRVVLLAKSIEELLPGEGRGKFVFGFSYFNVGNWAQRRKKDNTAIKDALKQQSISSRFITSDVAELSSAAVRGNGLVRKGAEFVVYADGDKELFGRTEYLHDIDSYTARDRARPARDAKIGMLPPKLAQILINLAASRDSEIIWDPLVGTGVVLQEALLDGYKVIGSDVSKEMVAASKENVEWLKSQHSGMPSAMIFRHDIREGWPRQVGFVDAIISEGYLGPPSFRQPNEAQINSLNKELADLYRNFFSAAAQHLRSGQRIAICFPYFRLASGMRRMPVIDELASNTYTLQGNYDYAPHGQIVGRQITIFEKV